MNEITFFQCGPNPGDHHPDEWMLVGLVDDGTEQREMIEESDARDRLMCECCQGYVASHADLTRSGPDLLCDDCCPAMEKTA